MIERDGHDIHHVGFERDAGAVYILRVIYFQLLPLSVSGCALVGILAMVLPYGRILVLVIGRFETAIAF